MSHEVQLSGCKVRFSEAHARSDQLTLNRIKKWSEPCIYFDKMEYSVVIKIYGCIWCMSTRDLLLIHVGIFFIGTFVWDFIKFGVTAQSANPWTHKFNPNTGRQFQDLMLANPFRQANQ